MQWNYSAWFLYIYIYNILIVHVCYLLLSCCWWLVDGWKNACWRLNDLFTQTYFNLPPNCYLYAVADINNRWRRCRRLMFCISLNISRSRQRWQRSYHRCCFLSMGGHSTYIVCSPFLCLWFFGMSIQMIFHDARLNKYPILVHHSTLKCNTYQKSIHSYGLYWISMSSTALAADKC